jgi:hypothetical protein
MAMAQDTENTIEPAAPARAAPASGHVALRRKAQAGFAEHQTKAMSLAKAFRVSVAKVADTMLDMAMAVLGYRTEQRTGEDLSEVFSDESLLILMDGPHRRRAGVIIEPAFVGALIQQQTMGSVLPDPGGEARGMTATDAAICAPFLDALLEATGQLPDLPEDRELVSGYQFGAQADNARLLDMALDALEYQVIHLTLDLASGARQGKVTFCFPVVNAGIPVEDIPDTDDVLLSQKLPHTLKDNVLGLNISLNVGLARVRMTLKQMGDMHVGQCIEVGTPSFDEVQVLTMAGRPLSKGVLGQLEGVRAVQLTVPKAGPAHPQRRAGDVPMADLSSPDTAMEEPLPPTPDFPDLMTDEPDIPAETEVMDDLPDLPDLPYMSDLPDLPDLDS